MTDTNEVAVTTPKSITPRTVSGFTTAQINLIKRTIAKGASDDELKLFLHIANKTGLDPFARQIYSVKRWDSNTGGYIMTTQTGIDGYRLIAERTGNYAPGKNTVYEYDGDKLLCATSFIQKKVGDVWFEVAATARYDEYVQLKKDGTPMHMWATKPHVMLSKCAEGLALRRAFPAELSGVYVSEEFGDEHKDEEIKAPAHLDDVLNPLELKWFHTEITNAGINKDIVKIEINKRFNLSTSKDLSKSQAAEIIEWAKSMQVLHGLY